MTFGIVEARPEHREREAISSALGMDGPGMQWWRRGRSCRRDSRVLARVSVRDAVRE